MNKIKPKIIFDTDIGDDIDDAFALLFLVESKAFDVLGVTTVFRNTRQRAHMAKYLLEALNSDIKVYAGCDYPLISNPDKLNVEAIQKKEKKDRYGMYQLPQWSEEMESAQFEKQHAVDFIIEQIHKYPHEVILCGVGPLTNFAIALRKDPTIVPLIKEFRLMSGGQNLNFAEWNVFCDPEASYIVYNSNVKTICIGIDTTCKLGLSKEDIDKLIHSKSKAIKITYDMMMKWFAHYAFEAPVMHDPLAVVSIIKPNLCQYEEKPLTVDLSNRRGFIVQDDKKAHNKLTISTDVNVREFINLFMSVIL